MRIFIEFCYISTQIFSIFFFTFFNLQIYYVMVILLKKFYFIYIIVIILYFYSFSNKNSEKNLQNNNISFIYPTEYTSLSSEYGNRYLYGYQNFHDGIDFLAPQNSLVYASCDGYVIYSSFLETGYGNTVIISHSNNLRTLYCHLSENFIVKPGQYVKQGEVIGYVGPRFLSNGIQNGNTTGPHLHFSIYKDNFSINPLNLL